MDGFVVIVRRFVASPAGSPRSIEGPPPPRHDTLDNYVHGCIVICEAGGLEWGSWRRVELKHKGSSRIDEEAKASRALAPSAGAALNKRLSLSINHTRKCRRQSSGDMVSHPTRSRPMPSRFMCVHHLLRRNHLPDAATRALAHDGPLRCVSSCCSSCSHWLQPWRRCASARRAAT